MPFVCWNFLSDKSAPPPIQIFATDISEQAIDTARAGIYAVNQMVEVSSERRRRFFHTLEGNRHQINKAVRELCVFARQDLGSDPPFSNLDLISCRNVMIYLGESLQKRLIPIFHYSLNTSGFFCCSAPQRASVDRQISLSWLRKKYRVYTKQPKATRPTFSFSPSRYPVAKTSNYQPVQDHPQGFDLPQQIDQLIANHYAPAAVVIDAKMQVMQLRGDIDLYLRLVSGVANFSLFNLVRVGLLIELRAAIYQAQRENMPVTKSGLCLEERGLSRTVTLQVIPFRVPTADEHRFFGVV